MLSYFVLFCCSNNYFMLGKSCSFKTNSGSITAGFFYLIEIFSSEVYHIKKRESCKFI